jgi:hypothetical protein
MSRKPKSKLPPEWQIYTNAHHKPAKRGGVAIWKYMVWAILLIIMAAIAFYPETVGRFL